MEGFDGKLRDERLNVSWFENLSDARRKIASCQNRFNVERPHSSLGYQTPAEYAWQLVPSSGSVPPCGTTPDERILSQRANVV